MGGMGREDNPSLVGRTRTSNCPKRIYAKRGVELHDELEAGPEKRTMTP